MKKRGKMGPARHSLGEGGKNPAPFAPYTHPRNHSQSVLSATTKSGVAETDIQLVSRQASASASDHPAWAPPDMSPPNNKDCIHYPLGKRPKALTRVGCILATDSAGGGDSDWEEPPASCRILSRVMGCEPNSQVRSVADVALLWPLKAFEDVGAARQGPSPLAQHELLVRGVDSIHITQSTELSRRSRPPSGVFKS